MRRGFTANVFNIRDLMRLVWLIEMEIFHNLFKKLWLWLFNFQLSMFVKRFAFVKRISFFSLVSHHKHNRNCVKFCLQRSTLLKTLSRSHKKVATIWNRNLSSRDNLFRLATSTLPVSLRINLLSLWNKKKAIKSYVLHWLIGSQFRFIWNESKIKNIHFVARTANKN